MPSTASAWRASKPCRPPWHRTSRKCASTPPGRLGADGERRRRRHGALGALGLDRRRRRRRHGGLSAARAGLMDVSQDLAFRVTELERRLSNLVAVGTVAEVDAAAARVRVRLGALLTDWRPWLAPRAAGVSVCAPRRPPHRLAPVAGAPRRRGERLVAARGRRAGGAPVPLGRPWRSCAPGATRAWPWSCRPCGRTPIRPRRRTPAVRWSPSTTAPASNTTAPQGASR